MGCCKSKHDPNRIFIKDYKNTLYDLEYWRNKDECCICLDNNSNILLLPCNHICMCQNCINMIRNNKCPICLTNIYSYNL